MLKQYYPTGLTTVKKTTMSTTPQHRATTKPSPPPHEAPGEAQSGRGDKIVNFLLAGSGGIGKVASHDHFAIKYLVIGTSDAECGRGKIPR